MSGGDSLHHRLNGSAVSRDLYYKISMICIVFSYDL